MKMMFPATRMNRSLGDFASDVNTIVDTLFGAAAGQSAESPVGFTPRMDIHEADDKFVIALDLPGVKSGDVHIDLNDDELVVHGLRQANLNTQNDGYIRVERWHGEFRRTVRLPRTVDREQISADFNDGVLSVWLPKLKALAARKIEINSGESNSNRVTTINSSESS